MVFYCGIVPLCFTLGSNTIVSSFLSLSIKEKEDCPYRVSLVDSHPSTSEVDEHGKVIIGCRHIGDVVHLFCWFMGGVEPVRDDEHLTVAEKNNTPCKIDEIDDQVLHDFRVPEKESQSHRLRQLRCLFLRTGCR